MTTAAELQIVDLELSEIYADETFNCRGSIAPIEVIELAKSIADYGLQQPITVQPWSLKEPFHYRIISGYRRHMAYKINGSKTIPAIVKEGLSDTDALTLNLMENLERKDLNIMQEAKTLARFYKAGCTEEEVIRRTNKSRGWVQVRFMALKMPEEIQEAIAAGYFTQHQIREIYKGDGDDERIALAKMMKEHKEKGESQKLTRKVIQKYDPDKKAVRSRKEIQDILDRIYDEMGANIITRTLAWASGEIPNGEFFESVKEYALSVGEDFTIPAIGEILQ